MSEAIATDKPTEFWFFDVNHRVYPKDGNHFSASPIWREHWRRREVVGETTRSWLVGSRYSYVKIPKKGQLPLNWVRSEAEVDEKC